MQLSFFSAAILAISAVNGISLNTSPEAQSLLDSNANTVTSSHALLDTWSTLLADGEGANEGENKAASWADADCEQWVGGKVIRLQIPECMNRPNTDQLILEATNELGKKANQLEEALGAYIAHKNAQPKMVMVPVMQQRPMFQQIPMTLQLVPHQPTATVSLAPATPVAPADPATAAPATAAPAAPAK